MMTMVKVKLLFKDYFNAFQFLSTQNENDYVSNSYN